MNKMRLTGYAALTFLLLAGLGVAAKNKTGITATAAADVTKAIAVLKPTEGNKVYGWVTFAKDGDKVKVVGDIEAGADGKVKIDLTDSMMRLDGPNSIIGRGVIVHGQADDLKSQPAGNAGPRQACAAIGVAKP